MGREAVAVEQESSAHGLRPGAGAARAPEFVAPSGFRERRMAALFTEVLGVERVGADDEFVALGGDAASAARLLDVIYEDCGVRLPPDVACAPMTVRTLVERVGRSKPTRDARLVGYGTDLPGPPLFCLMAAFQARTIARHFVSVAQRPFYVVQQAGLEGRSKVDRSVRARARRAVADIRSIQPEGPYLVSGYSSDSRVALEVVRQLRAAGERVDLYAVIDMWAPWGRRIYRSSIRVHGRWKTVCDRHPQKGPHYDAFRAALFVRSNVRDLSERIKWRMIGRTAGVFPRPTSVQSKLFHEVTKTADRNYRAKPIDFDVFLAKAQDFGQWDWKLRRTEPDLSWHRVTTARIEIVELSSNHVTLLEEEGAPELAAVLAGAVDAALERAGAPAGLAAAGG